MKSQEIKRQYVELRAEGNSYSQIAEKLHISKSTCTKWEKELISEIDELKRAKLEELYESYSMTKEARIKSLGGTLEKITTALEQADFSEVDPARLLDFKIRYTEALKGEYIGKKPALVLDEVNGEAIVSALTDLLNRVRAGDITTEQASKESIVLSHLLKAYENTEIKTQLEELKGIVGGR